MSTTGTTHRVPAGAPAGSSSAVAGRLPGTTGAHNTGSGPRCTTVPGISTTPLAGSSASATRTPSVVAPQRSTSSAGAARYGDQIAAATAEVARATAVRAHVAGLGSERSSAGAACTSRTWYFSTAWRTTARSR